MPTVHRKSLICLIYSIGAQDLVYSAVGRTILVILTVVFEAIRSAEIILCSCAAYSGKFIVAIKIKLYLAFSPPAVIIKSPEHISSDVMSVSAYVVKYSIYFLIWQRIHAAELSVEVAKPRLKLA